MKRSNFKHIGEKYKYYTEFDHIYACWLNNHNGWSKMKIKKRKYIKRILKRKLREDINNGI